MKSQGNKSKLKGIARRDVLSGGAALAAAAYGLDVPAPLR